mmetsp:Transcript_9071/g.37415  ORF Transcript_9071/g.37415 Transcript_9071/m.37415 type:complete len:442 (-) Transcript_9071:85-1410(-)|eukprot:CAMPEP_0114615540 /NCGR_PEP_ID=MMETSP0168-20121206/6216_1 /TAXON_ID=95228 ORGANISM="Vannella sp., Strain DIVA3 517/6/12" /NCGR_SAMPLE_ID=MMETSP0168 /ASSEMBLY_ACC=CAM_ASM_000044 /LENGTH=441 /DNA_ID=CAMNT_0001826611 /DNA_START=102 /DNA_END=1427 /DNA_ORIENTATION=-
MAEAGEAHAAAALVIQRCWRQRKALSELQARRKRQAKRKNLIEEIISTEKTYLWGTRVMTSCLLRPLLREPPKAFSKDLLVHLDSINSSLEVIVRCHTTLFAQLKSRTEPEIVPSICIGDIFVEISSYLKTYTMYITHYQEVVKILASKKGDAKFQKVLEGVISKECQGKGLKDHLIMPVQRIPRYNMMLADMVKATWPSHRDYDDLSTASSKVSEIAALIEERSAASARQQKVLQLVNLIKFPKGKQIKLAAAHRKYLFEADGLVTQRNGDKGAHSEYHLFVFSDMVLCCTRHKDSYKCEITLDSDSVLAVERFPAWVEVTAKKISSLVFANMEADNLDAIHEALVEATDGADVPDSDKMRNTIRISQSKDSLPSVKKKSSVKRMLSMSGSMSGSKKGKDGSSMPRSASTFTVGSEKQELISMSRGSTESELDSIADGTS